LICCSRAWLCATTSGRRAGDLIGAPTETALYDLARRQGRIKEDWKKPTHAWLKSPLIRTASS
jgi:hypothetical protein